LPIYLKRLSRSPFFLEWIQQQAIIRPMATAPRRMATRCVAGP